MKKIYLKILSAFLLILTSCISTQTNESMTTRQPTYTVEDAFEYLKDGIFLYMEYTYWEFGIALGSVKATEKNGNKKLYTVLYFPDELHEKKMIIENNKDELGQWKPLPFTKVFWFKDNTSGKEIVLNSGDTAVFQKAHMSKELEDEILKTLSETETSKDILDFKEGLSELGFVYLGFEGWSLGSQIETLDVIDKYGNSCEYTILNLNSKNMVTDEDISLGPFLYIGEKPYIEIINKFGGPRAVDEPIGLSEELEGKLLSNY